MSLFNHSGNSLWSYCMSNSNECQFNLHRIYGLSINGYGNLLVTQNWIQTQFKEYCVSTQFCNRLLREKIRLFFSRQHNKWTIGQNGGLCRTEWANKPFLLCHSWSVALIHLDIPLTDRSQLAGFVVTLPWLMVCLTVDAINFMDCPLLKNLKVRKKFYNHSHC